MPLIHTIAPQEATGELAQLYAQVLALRGRVPNSSQIWSSSPDLYKQQLAFIDYYRLHKSLSVALLASIRILVSSSTNCQYCVDFNSAMLINQMGWSPQEVMELKQEGTSIQLSEKENKMLSFVLKSVKNNKKADVNELNILRGLGWSDADLLDALQHGTRMLAVDIIFNTFDIENDNA